jgi:predicted peptidase
LPSARTKCPRAAGLLLLAFLVLAFAADGYSQAPPEVQFRTATVGKIGYRYELLVPAAWNAKTKWPVILFLHGAGERGEYSADANESVLARRFRRYPHIPNAIVVLPRCPTEGFWSTPEMEALALKALEQTMKEFNGDPARVYLTGLSMGGYGTWYLASRNPGTFAAIAPICGGIRTPVTIAIPAISTTNEPYADVARRIGKTPVWVFHGSADTTISVEESRNIVRALKAVGGNVRYTEYEGVGHNAWDPAYSDPKFFPWLLSHRLKN